MKNNPKTKMQKALSLFLTLLMVLGTLSIIGPISVAAAETVTVTFMSQKVDGEKLAAVTKDINTPLSDFVADSADVAALEWCKANETVGTDEIQRATVFAGWKTTDDTATYTKTSTIAASVTVYPTYITDAIIVTPEDISGGKTGTLSNGDGMLISSAGSTSASYIKDGDNPAYIQLLKTATGSSNITRFKVTPNSDGTTLVDYSSTPYLAIKAAKKTVTGGTATIAAAAKWYARFSTYSSSYTAGTKVYTSKTVATAFDNEVTGLEVLGMKDKNYTSTAAVVDIGPWDAKDVAANSYLNIYYFALLSNENAAEYVDPAKYAASFASTVNVTLNGQSVTVENGTTLAQLLADKKAEAATYGLPDLQYKNGEDYMVLAGGVKVGGEEKALDHKLQANDAITTADATYAPVYVYLPEQLYAIASHDAAGDDTPVNVELLNGYLRVVPDESVYKDIDSPKAPAGSSYRVAFDINGQGNKSTKKLFTSYRSTDIDLTQTGYYTISYKTNIDVGKLSVNMQLWDTTKSKYDWKFPTTAEMKADGSSQEWSFALKYNSTISSYLTDGIAAVRIPIYAGVEHAITADDYFDIAYIGFFPSAEAKELFDFDEYRTEYVYDGITVSATPGGTITTPVTSVLVGSAFNVTAAADSGDYILRNWYDITRGNNVPVNAVADGEAGLTTTLVAKSNDMWVVANFDSAAAEFPIPLIAFLDSASATLGKIKLESDTPTTYIYEEEVYPSETKALTAIPETGATFLYWKRYTQAGAAEVFLSSAASYDAHPLGGDVYYTPVFATSTGNLYIDKYTYEILKDYTPTGTEEASNLLSTDALNVYLIDPALDTTEKGNVTVVGLGGAWTATPAEDFNFGDGFTVTPTTTPTPNANPVWSIKVGEGEDVVVSYANQFKFNYMFAQNTAITITEGTLSGNKQNVIANLASWQETGYANFTAAFELNVDATVVEHGVLMSKTASDLANLENGTTFKVPNGVIVGRVSSATPTTIYTISKKLDGTETWYGRAYCTYKVGETTNVIYADGVLTASK